MSINPDDPRHQYSSTYFVKDRSNQDEMARLVVQDRLFTQGMGGPLPEQPEASNFRRILDVGCGTGDWLIETAKMYPDMNRLVGVDVNTHMIDYARKQAREQQVSDRVEFQVMDALLILEFPQGYFDLVNERFATSFMRTWNWPKLLDEMQRITRPGGVIRLTETEYVTSSSPAHLRLVALAGEAFYKAGHLFVEGKTGDTFAEGTGGVASDLVRLLQQYGVHDVQARHSLVEIRAGTPASQGLIEDMRLGGRVIIPFLRKWGCLPDNYEALYQQILDELQRPDLAVSVKLLTAWGTTTL